MIQDIISNFWMIVIIIIVLYFIIKYAVKNGVKEAYHEIQKNRKSLHHIVIQTKQTPIPPINNEVYP